LTFFKIFDIIIIENKEKNKIMQFTYDELTSKIFDSEEGSLQLSLEDCQILQAILLKRGYAVLLTGGDIGDNFRISWIYAGNTSNLNWANRQNICFSDSEYLDMLTMGDYAEEKDEDSDNS
jgi:hypothetical protein